MHNWDSEIFVLDATAFYQGFHLRCDRKCITTDLILKEVSHIKKDYFPINFLIEAQKLTIAHPKQDTVNFVKSVVKTIGDSSISSSDISVLALASDQGGTLISDDNRICNLAQFLSISFLKLSGKSIKGIRRWTKFCRECGRQYSFNECICSICGKHLSVRYRERKSAVGQS